VNDNQKGLMDADDFLAWVDKYDNIELEYCEVALPATIDKVFVSRQQRAVKSAAYLALESEMSDLLVEVDAQAFMSGKIKLPKNLWLFIDRLRWYLNFRSVENRSHTIKRARDFIEKIKDIEDVLIVSHGLFMHVLIDELKKEGFEGSIDKKIKNATVYTLERGVR
jgi:broad specificity phosphatase PhoE